MAEIKVSALPAATAPDGTEVVPVVQGGVTKRLPVGTGNGLATLINGKLDPAQSATFALVTATADLLVGTGPGALGRLGKGAALDVLRVNAAGTALEYAAPAAPAATVAVACQLTRTADTAAIASAALVAIPWDSQRAPTGGYHDVAVNPERVTVPAGKGGEYLLIATFEYAPNATGDRFAHFRKNGTLLVQGQAFPAATGAANTTSVTAVCQLPLAAGDYMELMAYQTSGAALAVKKRDRVSPELQVVRIS